MTAPTPYRATPIYPIPRIPAAPAPSVELELLAVRYVNDHDCEVFTRPSIASLNEFFIGYGLSVWVLDRIADRVVALCGGAA